MYAAYWQTPNGVARVFPRTKKTSFFKTIELASKALEYRARNCEVNTRGLVYSVANGEKTLAYTIAL